ncbi:MAG: SMP-30/gluconolactonase/LRE family protein [Gammaproteobacteria bacterium]|nr:MAG: SMP-30/gluconolactonase/LRE family protein [Gammaproteobacteria bacterium]
MTGFRVIAEGLAGPEGPVALADGSVLVCEMAAGRVTRVLPDGRKVVAAETGGTPNGAAIGPDGWCYVCNRGASKWQRFGEVLVPIAQDEPGDPQARGYIQRFDLASGRVELLYERAGDLPLGGPNDLIFDAAGGFWFTDFGRIRHRDIDLGSIFYAKADGSFIREVRGSFYGPNGIGLSPDGRWLYVAETYTSQLYRFEVSAPGEIRFSETLGFGSPGGYFVGAPGGLSFFDSLAVDSAGAVIVANGGEGRLTVFPPDGGACQHIALPDLAPTNVCFGGHDLRTAYVTLMMTGKLIAIDWPRPGLRLNFQQPGTETR